MYFQDGSWGSSLSNIQADILAIGGVTTSDTAKISSINYATNTITLTTAKTWSNNDNIYLWADSDGTQVLYGDAPDIGASEYNMGGAPEQQASQNKADVLSVTAEAN